VLLVSRVKEVQVYLFLRSINNSIWFVSIKAIIMTLGIKLRLVKR